MTIYVISSMQAYYTQRYQDLCSEILRHYPDSQLLLPRDLYRTSGQWRDMWPELSLDVDLGIVIGELPDAPYIGMGAFVELRDLAILGTPRVWLRDGGEWIDNFAAVQISNDWARYAILAEAVEDGLQESDDYIGSF